MLFKRIVLRNMEKRGEAKRIYCTARKEFRNFLIKYPQATINLNKYGQIVAVAWVLKEDL